MTNTFLYGKVGRIDHYRPMQTNSIANLARTAKQQGGWGWVASKVELGLDP